ncbi:MAG: hypothetical protein NVSMB64_14020 [Candidatus Velthaea sp.]
MKPPFGETRKFPRGKVHKSDEGELVFGIATDHAHGTVVLNFGKPVAWLAMPPDQALVIANALIEHARKLMQSPPQPTPN